MFGDFFRRSTIDDPNEDVCEHAGKAVKNALPRIHDKELSTTDKIRQQRQFHREHCLAKYGIYSANHFLQTEHDTPVGIHGSTEVVAIFDEPAS